MLKLFVVDDYPLVGETIRYILRDRQNVEYIGQALSGNKGLEYAKKYRPDIAFVDIKMPGMDGLTLIKCLKEALPDIKAVISTAFDDFEYIQRALRIGASDYLLKPLDRQEFLSVVDKLCKEINGSGAAAAKSIEYSPVIVEKLQELFSCIRAGETEYACSTLDAIWQEMTVFCKRDGILIKKHCTELAASVFLLMEKNDCSSEAVRLSYRFFKKRVSNGCSVGYLKNCTQEFIESISDSFCQNMQSNRDRQISLAKELIESNLYKKITLESISSSIYLSPYYLSHLFKKKNRRPVY